MTSVESPQSFPAGQHVVTATEPAADPPTDAEELLHVVNGPAREALLHRRRSGRDRLMPRSLLLADLAGLCLAYALATLLATGDGVLGTPREMLVFALTLPCWVLAAKLHGLYEHDQARTDHTTTDDVVGIVHIVTAGVLLLLVASRVAGRASPSVDALIVFWGLAICVLPAARTIAREVCRHSAAYTQNAIIVGAGEVGQLIGRKLIRHPEYGVNVVGFVDSEPRARRSDLPEHFSILGPPQSLPDLVRRLDVDRVVIAFSHASAAELVSLVRRLSGLPVQIDLVPRLFELVGPHTNVYGVEGIPLLGLTPTRAGRGARALKRGLDVVASAAGLILLAPLLGWIALRIHRGSPGPVLFRQTRLGIEMREFELLKFRTMKVETDSSAHRDYIRATMSASAEADESGLYKLDRGDSVTSVGRWLRRTSLDELPQLVNILRGDMSLVGPRPCIPYEVENFERHHLERFSVPQGLTGLWQVAARANSTYGESLDMDVAYARNWSLGLDLRLLLRTPGAVLRQRSSTA